MQCGATSNKPSVLLRRGEMEAAACTPRGASQAQSWISNTQVGSQAAELLYGAICRLACKTCSNVWANARQPRVCWKTWCYNSGENSQPQRRQVNMHIQWMCCSGIAFDARNLHWQVGFHKFWSNGRPTSGSKYVLEAFTMMERNCNTTSFGHWPCRWNN